MCGDCGCEEGNKDYFADQLDKTSKTYHLSLDVLAKNNHIAHHNHHWFDDNKVTAINLMSSPGSGKTTLLEVTAKTFNSKINMSIVVGDQQTDRDADRLAKAGANAKQIITMNSCHLDAEMVEKELDTFVKKETDLLFIENVGNLVCPSAFDLGESKKVALLSVTEGEDKPIKYPVLFHKADVILLTKSDLMPHLDWNEEECMTYIREVNPKARVIKLSAKTGEGMDEWFNWLSDTLCA